MKKLTTIGSLSAATLSLLFLGSTPANALLSLTLDDGVGNSVTLTDDDGTDQFAGLGVISWSGSLGVWSVNVSTGISDSPTPYMDLNSVNRSTAAGTMTITISDDGFTPDGTAFADVGGTTGGSVAIDTFYNGVNALTSTFDNTSPFSSTDSASFSVVGSYGLTMVATITHGAGTNTSSFDAELVVVPEPTAIALLGVGLLAAGVTYRRRRRNA